MPGNFQNKSQYMKPTSQNNNLLEVQGLQKYFPVRRGFLQKTIGWIKAVDGVDFTIEKGKTLGLVGESGCGKSTIGRLILRLMDPDTGRVVFKKPCARSLSYVVPAIAGRS